MDATQRYDPNTAFVVELLAGFFGFLGIGYMYAGRTNEGIIRLIVWWVFIGMSLIYWVVIYPLLSAATLGVFALLGCLCLPVQFVLQFGGPIWSAMTLKNELADVAKAF
jgi:TM2 domain-containing membrane protein YozV